MLAGGGPRNPAVEWGKTTAYGSSIPFQANITPSGSVAVGWSVGPLELGTAPPITFASPPTTGRRPFTVRTSLSPPPPRRHRRGLRSCGLITRDSAFLTTSVLTCRLTLRLFSPPSTPEELLPRSPSNMGPLRNTARWCSASKPSRSVRRWINLLFPRQFAISQTNSKFRGSTWVGGRRVGGMTKVHLGEQIGSCGFVRIQLI